MKFFNTIITIGALGSILYVFTRLITPAQGRNDIQSRDQGDYICFFIENGSTIQKLSCIAKPVEWTMTCVPTMKPYCPEYTIKPKSTK